MGLAVPLRTFTLNLGEGTPVDSGKPLLLMVSPSNVSPLQHVFGCPGGEYTYPSEVAVVSLCDLDTVDCATNHGAGSWCDSPPQTPFCMECTGDFDGCADGVMTAIGGGQPKCWADTNPNGSGDTGATSIIMNVRTITWFFNGGTTTQALQNPITVDLLALTSGAAGALDGLTIPMLPGNPALQGLELEGDAAAILPGQSSFVPIALRSGPADLGDRLRISVQPGANGPPMGGSMLHVIAFATPGVDFRRLYTCAGGERTFTSWLAVSYLPPVGPPGPPGGGFPPPGGGAPPPPGSPPPPPGGGQGVPGGDPNACQNWVMPTAVQVELTSLTLRYDDGTMQTLQLPPNAMLDVIGALNGNDVFGGMLVPSPPYGSTSTALMDIRVHGSFNGLAFDPTAMQTLVPRRNPMNPVPQPGESPNDGMLFVFEPNTRPQVGDPLRMVRSTTAMTNERVYQCPGGQLQITSSLTVRSFVPGP